MFDIDMCLNGILRMNVLVNNTAETLAKYRRTKWSQIGRPTTIWKDSDTELRGLKEENLKDWNKWQRLYTPGRPVSYMSTVDSSRCIRQQHRCLQVVIWRQPRRKQLLTTYFNKSRLHKTAFHRDQAQADEVIIIIVICVWPVFHHKQHVSNDKWVVPARGCSSRVHHFAS